MTISVDLPPDARREQPDALAGRLRLLEVQSAGRKRMKAADFARGRRLALGAHFGAVSRA